MQRRVRSTSRAPGSLAATCGGLRPPSSRDSRFSRSRAALGFRGRRPEQLPARMSQNCAHVTFAAFASVAHVATSRRTRLRDGPALRWSRKALMPAGSQGQSVIWRVAAIRGWVPMRPRGEVRRPIPNTQCTQRFTISLNSLRPLPDRPARSDARSPRHFSGESTRAAPGCSHVSGMPLAVDCRACAGVRRARALNIPASRRSACRRCARAASSGRCQPPTSRPQSGGQQKMVQAQTGASRHSTAGHGTSTCALLGCASGDQLEFDR